MHWAESLIEGITLDSGKAISTPAKRRAGCVIRRILYYSLLRNIAGLTASRALSTPAKMVASLARLLLKGPLSMLCRLLR
jgi:hypothetical protein